MNVSIEIDDNLYRKVEAKSALEGRTIREVTEALLLRHLREIPSRAIDSSSTRGARRLDGELVPSWYGALGGRADHARHHDLRAIRASIAAAVERGVKLDQTGRDKLHSGLLMVGQTRGAG